MKKSALILASILFLSCGEEKKHRYIVVHNNYRDTTEIVAKYYRTEVVSKMPPIKGVKSVAEFTSSYGVSTIFNVDHIIAKDSINN